MNYIYDIILNFHTNYYQFFEWQKTDTIKNIIRIPIYRVSDIDLKILKDNNVTIDNIFLNKIKEDNKKYKKIICLVSNTKLTIGLLFDCQGNLLKRSSLIYDEEEEANNICKNLKITKIKYIKNKPKEHQNKLRIELEKKEVLIKYLNKLTDLSTLKYLYYEYFNKECNNEIIIKNSLKKELNKNWTLKQNNLYKLIAILSKAK